MNSSNFTTTIKTAVPGGPIRKSLLTPCPRIGLSRKLKPGSFKSPLIQKAPLLSYGSPVENYSKQSITSTTTSTPIASEAKSKSDMHSKDKSKRSKQENEPKREVKKRLIEDSSPVENTHKEPHISTVTSTPITAENKHKDDNHIENKSKRPRRESKPRRKVKMIEDSSESEEENFKSLNVSGCDLLGTHEKNEVDAQSIIKDNNKLKQIEKKSLETKKLCVNLKQLPIDLKDLTNETEKENSSSQSRETDKKSNQPSAKTEEEVLKESKDLSNKKILNSPPVNSKAISPKTIVAQLETKPLIDAFSPFKEKVENKLKSKSKNSIDEYIKKKEKQKTSSNASMRKLSMKKSSLTTDSFESDEEFMEKPRNQNVPIKKIDKSDLINKIVELEKVVHDKEGLLEQYKHAEVYHKLHDVNKLNELTKIWKNGCESALQDLLVKLREHGDIDMQRLMKKLGAPVDLIKYNAESGVFV